METLFIVDSLKDLDKKISMIIDNFGDKIKFFANSKLIAKLSNNKFIVKNLVSIYSDKINDTIDKYIKSTQYVPQDTIIYFSSAKLDDGLVCEMRQKLQYHPVTVYVKKKLNFFDKIKLWLYNKLIKLVVGMEDKYASVKFQYINAELMSALKQTKFRNHLFAIPNADEIELEKENVKSFYDKPKFNKNYLYSPIIFCLVLIAYVILESFVKVQFWMYFLIILSLISIIVSTFILIIKNVFDTRFKK